MLLAALDWFLTIVHVGVVLAFVFLWIPKATARAHGILVAATAFSWLVIGLFEGNIGYCVLTDLNWRVKRARGVTHLPGSFLKYLADRITGISVPIEWVNTVATVMFLAGCAAALIRFRQARRSRSS